MDLRIAFLLLLFGSYPFFSTGQNKQTAPDSLHRESRIEKFAHERSSGNFFLSLLFKPVNEPQNTEGRTKFRRYAHPSLEPYENKIIRNILINTYDPFGYDINDSTVSPAAFLYKAGNSLHVKTFSLTIKNLLLFKKNTPFDSVQVIESEHLIRSQRYVHEVNIVPVLAGSSSDSVDIFIRVIDVWSIELAVSVRTVGSEFILMDNNFLGTGHRFSNALTRTKGSSRSGYTGSYFIPEILGTYSNLKLSYGIDENKSTEKQIQLERPFFSSFTKWAGGVDLQWNEQRGLLYDTGSVVENFSYKTRINDDWAGGALQVGKIKDKNDHITNLIFTARQVNVRYFPSATAPAGFRQTYPDENFYLASVGISTRSYFRDKYIFKYGVIEDVPNGKLIALTGGYRVSNHAGRTYTGMLISWGNYNRLGYIYTSMDYGTYIRNSHFEQGAFNAEINYFTDLLPLGRWRFRQFIKPTYTLGINRLRGDDLSLNTESGLKGFDSPTVTGTQRFAVTLQTQSYSPWNVLGFNFGPYLIAAAGMVGNGQGIFYGSTLYTRFGIGVLIKNEFLILRTVQFSLAYFPVIPGSGRDLIRMNTFHSNDIGLNDFAMGKPSTVSY